MSHKEESAHESEGEDNEEECPYPSFWCGIVKPEEPFQVEFPQYCSLQLTGVCIDELPEGESKPVRLIADVESFIFPEDLTKQEEPDKKKSICLIASLVPGEKEFQSVNILFTQFDNVKLLNKGSVPIHITGTLLPDDPEFEEEEEQGDGDENCECGHCEDHAEKKEE